MKTSSPKSSKSKNPKEILTNTVKINRNQLVQEMKLKREDRRENRASGFFSSFQKKSQVESQNQSSSHIRHFSYVRVLGLFLVLIYHFYPKIMPGGFIGVDIFFTFSGYLITALVLEEVNKSHHFDIKRFAERRFFRIFPTVFFAMLITVPLTLLGNADLRYQLRQQVFAGLSFVTNLFEASTGASYENNFAPHLFVHLWSLAIEVQFYLVWGIILWFLIKFLKGQLKVNVFFISAIIFVVTSIAMFVASIFTHNYSQLYYSPIYHIFPFFVGAALANLAGIRTTPLIQKFSKRMTIVRLWQYIGLDMFFLVLLSLILHFDWKITYMIGFSLASLATALLIFFLRTLHEITDYEEPEIFHFVSDISYGVYIFHWAFLVIFLNLRIPHLLAVLMTLVFSFALAALMFYGIDPLLRNRPSLFSIPKKGLVWATGILLIPTVIAIFNSAPETTLASSLWQASVKQGSENLYMAKEWSEKGVVGSANTLVIGDSVANGTRTTFGDYPVLEKYIPGTFGDTAGDRTISRDLKADLKSSLRYLPAKANIVIALGTNSIDPDRDIQVLKEVIKEYSPEHHIVLVTPSNISSGGPYASDKVADWEVSIDGKYKNITIADWRAAAKGHPEYVDADGVHLADRSLGRQVWLETVKNALNK